MQNQFSQAGRSPYRRTNSSVHATKAVGVLNTSTSSVYFLDTQARLVLQMSFQSPALTAANGIRVWTEIQLSHGRCQTISGGCWDRGMQMLLRWQEFRIWKSLQCPTKVYDGPSQCTRRRGQEGPPAPSFNHSYMHKLLRANLPGETAGPWLWLRRKSCGLQLTQARSGYPSVLLVQGFPTNPMCCSAWRLQKNSHPVTCIYSYHMMCWSLRSLLKHSRTNFLG